MTPPLPRGPFAVVVLDPPWDVCQPARMPRWPANGNTGLAWRWNALPYAVMSDADIAALDVPGILAADAWVLLWCVSSRLVAAHRLAEAWGLRARGVRVWRKRGGPQLCGQWQSNAEFVLVASAGSPRWTSTRGFRAVFDGERPRRTDPCACERRGERRCASCPPRFEHSAKPSEFYADLAARTVGPRLDMFSRRRHPGFEAWGDQAP